MARELEIVVPDPVYRPPVLEVLGDAMHEAHKGEEAEHVEGRQDSECEDLEGVADGRDLTDEAERDQGAGDREE